MKETVLILKLTKDKRITFEQKEIMLGPNDFFSTTSCIAAMPRISSVKIVEDSSIMVVERSKVSLLNIFSIP